LKFEPLQGCHRLRNGQGKKFFKVREKSGEIGILKKSQGKLSTGFNTSGLMPVIVGRNIWGHYDLNNIFH